MVLRDGNVERAHARATRSTFCPHRAVNVERGEETTSCSTFCPGAADISSNPLTRAVGPTAQRAETAHGAPP